MPTFLLLVSVYSTECIKNTSIPCINCKTENKNPFKSHINITLYTIIFFYIVGYNKVVDIPAGAASIEIRQHGYQNKVDENYLGEFIFLAIVFFFIHKTGLS